MTKFSSAAILRNADCGVNADLVSTSGEKEKISIPNQSHEGVEVYDRSWRSARVSFQSSFVKSGQTWRMKPSYRISRQFFWHLLLLLCFLSLDLHSVQLPEIISILSFGKTTMRSDRGCSGMQELNILGLLLQSSHILHCVESLHQHCNYLPLWFKVTSDEVWNLNSTDTNGQVPFFILTLSQITCHSSLLSFLSVIYWKGKW